MASSPPGTLWASPFQRTAAGRSGTSRCRCSGTPSVLGADNNGQQRIIRGSLRVVVQEDEGQAGTSGLDGPRAASADEEHLPDQGGGGRRPGTSSISLC